MAVYKMRLPNGWYPKNNEECSGEIIRMMKHYAVKGVHRTGGIIPHAGWYFSGKLAAGVFQTLSKNNPAPDIICLFGGHLSPKHPVLALDYDEAETPLGNIPIDRALTEAILKEFPESRKDQNDGDNTVEINLPLIRYIFPNARLIAFRSPPSELAVKLGQVVAAAAKARKLNLISVGAADLTHYGSNYGFMPQGRGDKALDWMKNVNDRNLIEAVLKKNPAQVIERSLRDSSSCSGGAIASALAYSMAASDSEPLLLDYYTSYDVYPSDSFVGYAGILL